MEKRFVIPLILAFAILMIGFASATITINTPTSGLAVNGTYLFNATSDQVDVLNCSFATTGDSVFATTINDTSADTDFANSTDTSALTDALATTLTVTCSNATALQSATATFDVDNTDPSCSFTIDRDFVGRQSGLGITVAEASSDTTTLTWLFNLTNEEGTQKITSTSQNPSFTNGDLEDLGDHTINLTVTDEVGKTDSCTKNFLITGSGSGDDGVVAGEVIVDVENTRRNVLLGVIVAVVIIVILVVLLWYYTNKAR